MVFVFVVADPNSPIGRFPASQTAVGKKKQLLHTTSAVLGMGIPVLLCGGGIFFVFG